MPPGFGVLGLTFLLIADGPLRSRNDGLIAIGVKHLARIVMNFDLLVPSPASRRTLIQPARKSFH
jgi:hypothetical protein